ncbi:MAG: nucleoside-diphosphate kinase [Opitutae bacterium]|nr:nucleoside-diphosphate kinase [Opitutae bacterium]|tara:strand:+ start:3889 stop:4305 length:417 start_codon:yes stop_codon:yes gene_type:complete
MERSLVLLKPDCLDNNLAGKVITLFEENAFTIIASKMIQLDNDLLNEHYAHVAHLPFFPEISAFMSSRPVMALVLEGENVIHRVRDLLGPTDSTTAPTGTIRGDFGTNRMKNIAHASDGPESALVEINRFFDADQICD